LAGIYIHVPFCKQKCHYCNFYSIASTRYRDDFVAALLNEIRIRSNYLENEVVKTIYFGGGTPSMLKVDEINSIVDFLKKTFSVSEEVEITLEANPDDLREKTPQSLKHHTAINRLSIGVQSFFDDDLKYLNRVHSGKDAINSIENSIKAGFKNITLDLIYGIPGLSNSKWRENLKIFFDFEVNHLSSYSLTVEPRTALHTLIAKKKMIAVNEEESIEHFKILLEETEKHNFVHYEISNFAKEGFYSKHNSIYWLGGNYAGFGPSAHSFNGKSRQWNVANMTQYIAADTVEKVVLETEILSIEQQFNEYVMTSLRTSWGCDITHIENVFGKRFSEYFSRGANKYLKEKKLILKGSVYTLSSEGKLFADGIAADLFL